MRAPVSVAPWSARVEKVGARATSSHDAVVGLKAALMPEVACHGVEIAPAYGARRQPLPDSSVSGLSGGKEGRRCYEQTEDREVP